MIIIIAIIIIIIIIRRRRRRRRRIVIMVLFPQDKDVTTVLNTVMHNKINKLITES